jgi:hypothetical protein
MFRGKEELPAMVVAIRGSASHVDHMVNANGQGRDARLLFVSDAPLSRKRQPSLLILESTDR